MPCCSHQPPGKDGVDHLRVIHPALGNEGGKADARPLAADCVADGGQYLPGKTDPVVQATAVLIGTLVGGPPQELVDQIAIAAVYFHAVKPRRDRIARRLTVIGDNTLDIRPGERPRR